MLYNHLTLCRRPLFINVHAKLTMYFITTYVVVVLPHLVCVCVCLVVGVPCSAVYLRWYLAAHNETPPPGWSNPVVSSHACSFPFEI